MGRGQLVGRSDLQMLMKMVDILYVSESYLLVFITLLLVIASVRINSVTVGIGSGRLHVITISPQRNKNQ